MSVLRPIRLGAALSLVCSSPIRAQTQPGVTFDQKIISVKDNGGTTVTDSAFVHVTATARKMKLDVNGDIPDMKGMPGGKNVVMLLGDGGTKMTFVKDYLDKVLKAHERVRGFPLRVIKQETKTAEGVTQKSLDTTYITNIKRQSAPDATFAIPADYKQFTIPIPPTIDTTATGQ